MPQNVCCSIINKNQKKDLENLNILEVPMSQISYKYFDWDGKQPMMDEPCEPNITLTWIVFFAEKFEEPKSYNIHVPNSNLEYQRCENLKAKIIPKRQRNLSLCWLVSILLKQPCC